MKSMREYNGKIIFEDDITEILSFLIEKFKISEVLRNRK